MSGRGTDVVVVGGGGAALAAAITAAELGCSVCLLEKSDRIGGSTAMSIGSVTAAGTAQQRRAGIEDSAEGHLADMPAWAGTLVNRDNATLWKVMTDHGADTLRWLEDSGLVFIGPFPEPPHRKPRMHNVVPNSRAFAHHLSRRARRSGVRMITGARASKLLVEGGKVTGVEAELNGGVQRFDAARGVVLAAGDYNASRTFKEEAGCAEQVAVPAINAHATGDCHRMAIELGAHVLNADIAFPGVQFRFRPPARPSRMLNLPPSKALTSLMRFSVEHLPAAVNRPFVMKFMTAALAPDRSLFAQPGVVLMDRHGAVLPVEDNEVGRAIAAADEALAYVVMSDAVARTYDAWPHFLSTAPGIAYAYVSDYLRARPDICFKADSPGSLAHRLGWDRPAALPEAMGGGPFVVMGPLHAYTILSDGGLAISERFEVLDGSNQPIPGLYAIGSTGQGGLLLRGHGHHLAWAFTSGRLVGAQLAGRA